MSEDQAWAHRNRRIVLPSQGAGEMAYLDFGDPRRPVDLVFLHANGFNALTYRYVLGPLATSFRFLAIDQRGHGATTLDASVLGRRDWLDLRDDLLAFLAALNLSSVVLAGHSMGATVCLLAAASEPHRCRRLALFDPVILPPARPPASTESPLIQAALRRRSVFPDRDAVIDSYRGRGAFKTWPDAMLADYVAAGFQDTPEGEVALACAPAWEASGFSAHGHDPWRAIAQSSCPIQILRAETASTFSMDGLDLTDNPRIQVATVPGSTHFLPMEFPEIIRETLTSALNTAPRPAG